MSVNINVTLTLAYFIRVTELATTSAYKYLGILNIYIEKLHLNAWRSTDG